jgi:hypothetical protein
VERVVALATFVNTPTVVGVTVRTTEAEVPDARFPILQNTAPLVANGIPVGGEEKPLENVIVPNPLLTITP